MVSLKMLYVDALRFRSIFLSKERVLWRRLDTVEKSPGGREEYLRAGRISEACPGEGVGAVALAGNTDVLK